SHELITDDYRDTVCARLSDRRRHSSHLLREQRHYSLATHRTRSFDGIRFTPAALRPAFSPAVDRARVLDDPPHRPWLDQLARKRRVVRDRDWPTRRQGARRDAVGRRLLVRLGAPPVHDSPRYGCGRSWSLHRRRVLLLLVPSRQPSGALVLG